MKMHEKSSPVEESKTQEEPKKQEEPKPVDKKGTGEESRRSPRLQCAGLAKIQTLPACEKPCPARIVNLSEGGCLMELQQPLTLSEDEIVELIFSVNQIPFHVRGKARAIRSDKLVGFQFPQLNDRVRKQLQDLIGELIEHLAKLHRESIAMNSKGHSEKHPHEPAAPTAHGTFVPHRTSPAAGQPGHAVNLPSHRSRWF